MTYPDFTRYEPYAPADASIPSALVSQGRRPIWLLGPYSDDTWTVRDTGDKPNCTIRFDVHLPGGRRLADHRNLVEPRNISCRSAKFLRMRQAAVLEAFVGVT